VAPARSSLPLCPLAGPTVVLAPHVAVGTHKVTLSWKASAPSPNPDSDAVGYCVYRRKENKAETSAATQNPTLAGRERINLFPVLGTTCVDDEVANATIYSYLVTAVNARGIPSFPSNEVAASIPADEPKSPAKVNAPLCRGVSGAHPKAKTD